jgi:hypothetical protein
MDDGDEWHPQGALAANDPYHPLGTVGIDWYYTDKDDYIDQKYAWAKIASNFFAGVDDAGEGFSYLPTSDVSLGGETVISSNSILRALAMRSGDGLRAYV